MEVLEMVGTRGTQHLARMHIKAVEKSLQLGTS